MPDLNHPLARAAFDREEHRRVLRFLVVGGSNTAITLLVYAALIELGAPYPAAAAIGYAAGIVNGYTWNRIWTFRAGSFHLPEFSRYALVSLGGLGANVLGVVLAVEALGMGEVVGEVAALIPIVVITYSLYRWWAFRPRTEPRAES